MNSLLCFTLVLIGIVSSQSCVDKTDEVDCESYTSLCKNPIYASTMTEYCPKSCGRCNSPSNSCKDAVDDCSTKTHLCNTPSYESMMNQYCRKTCGRCG